MHEYFTFVYAQWNDIASLISVHCHINGGTSTLFNCMVVVLELFFRLDKSFQSSLIAEQNKQYALECFRLWDWEWRVLDRLHTGWHRHVGTMQIAALNVTHTFFFSETKMSKSISESICCRSSGIVNALWIDQYVVYTYWSNYARGYDYKTSGPTVLITQRYTLLEKHTNNTRSLKIISRKTPEIHEVYSVIFGV